MQVQVIGLQSIPQLPFILCGVISVVGLIFSYAVRLLKGFLWSFLCIPPNTMTQYLCTVPHGNSMSSA
ncbi:hypothetical protein A0H81_12388 [Grifola frondosa]|uniref:Uncharacterized protein n=1 Tax=Grifola frondosa TaxID=5627 RepID=A0A1C7LTI9_GRIFR|nr:hypothetical protein A0H81_12388 [Grifola frondosa]